MNQWFPIKPSGSVTEPIPPFALCKRADMSFDGTAISVAKPDADSDLEVIVNGEASVNPDIDNVIGKGSYDNIITAAYDPDESEPTIGSEWGAKADSWYLTSGQKGFRVIGVPSNGAVTVLRTRPNQQWRQGFWAILTTNTGRRWNYRPVSMLAGSGSGLPLSVGTVTTGFPAFETPLWSDQALPTNNINSTPVAGSIVWMYFPSPESSFPEFQPIWYASPTNVGLVNTIAQSFTAPKTFYHAGSSGHNTIIDGGTITSNNGIGAGVLVVVGNGMVIADRIGTFKEQLIVGTVPAASSGSYIDQAIIYTGKTGGGVCPAFNVGYYVSTGTFFRTVSLFRDAVNAGNTTDFANNCGDLAVGGGVGIQGGAYFHRAFVGAGGSNGIFRLFLADNPGGAIVDTACAILMQPAKWGTSGIGTPLTYYGSYIDIGTDGTPGPAGGIQARFQVYWYDGRRYVVVSNSLGVGASSPLLVSFGGFAAGLDAADVGQGGTDPMGNVFSKGLCTHVSSGGGGGGFTAGSLP